MIFGATTTSVALSVIGVGLIVAPISAGVACALSLGSKILHQPIINKQNKYKNVYENDQQTIISFDNLYRKLLQNIIFDKIEYECLRNILTKYLEETRTESFL